MLFQGVSGLFWCDSTHDAADGESDERGGRVPDDPRQTPDKHDPARDFAGNKDVWKFLGLGTQLGVTVGLFVALGWWLDQHFGWTPCGILVFGVLGVAAGMYHFLKEVMR